MHVYFFNQDERDGWDEFPTENDNDINSSVKNTLSNVNNSNEEDFFATMNKVRLILYRFSGYIIDFQSFN